MRQVAREVGLASAYPPTPQGQRAALRQRLRTIESSRANRRATEETSVNIVRFARVTMGIMVVGFCVSLMGVARADPRIGNGIYTAQVGAECQTVENGLFASTMSDLERATEMVRNDDMEAFRKWEKAGRVGTLRGGLTIFVEHRFESMGRRDMVEMRPKGETVTFWTSPYSLNCPNPATKQSK